MLSNKVSEIMTTSLTTAQATDSVFKVMEMMTAKDVGRVIITDNEVPAGIFTEKDVLRRVVNAAIDPRQTSIKQVMTSPIRAVREDTHIVEAFGKMYRGKFRHLLVRGRGGKIVGTVSMRRILKIAVELGQGKNDTKTLASITTVPAVLVDQASTIRETIETMIKKNVNAVLVASEGKPAGIFTERDVLNRVATKDINPGLTAVKEMMTAPLIAMPKTAVVADVLAEMFRRDIRNMPVSGENGEITGIMSMPDILQYAQAFDVDERVRQTWKEIQEFYDSEDFYTPG